MNTGRVEAKGVRPRDTGRDVGLRVAVVGGGLAGLAAALRLTDLGREVGKPVLVTLFEASGRLGGAIETVREAGYLVERGADSFLTAKPAAVRLCERLGLADQLLPTDPRYRGALVLRDGRPVRVPDGFNLMTPTKLWPVVTTPILSPMGKARLLAEAVVPRRTADGDESLGSFVRRRLGREAFERLVQPLVSGIYTADPEKLSLAATLPRFPEMERKHGSLIRATFRNRRALSEGEANASGARYGLFAGLREGMGQLFDALRTRVRAAAEVRTGVRVERVRRDADGWLVETADHQREKFDGAVVALPAYAAGAVLNDMDNELARSLLKIAYASSAVVVTGHRLEDVQHPLDAFGLVIPTIENRDVLAVSFASRKFPGRAPAGCILLRTFTGGATRPDMAERTDEELVAVVRRELSSLLGVSGMPELTVVSRYERAMPQYHVGHLDLVRRIETAAARHPGLELTGSAYRGVGIPDVIADAERAVGAVFTTLHPLRSREKGRG